MERSRPGHDAGTTWIASKSKDQDKQPLEPKERQRKDGLDTAGVIFGEEWKLNQAAFDDREVEQKLKMREGGDCVRRAALKAGRVVDEEADVDGPALPRPS